MSRTTTLLATSCFLLTLACSSGAGSGAGDAAVSVGYGGASGSGGAGSGGAGSGGAGGGQRSSVGGRGPAGCVHRRYLEARQQHCDDPELLFHAVVHPALAT